MTKRSGYSLKISAFIEASPTNMDEMRLAISAIDAACEALRKDGFQGVTHVSRFMLSKDIPDEPKAAQAVPDASGGFVGSDEKMPELPPTLRRA